MQGLGHHLSLLWGRLELHKKQGKRELVYAILVKMTFKCFRNIHSKSCKSYTECSFTYSCEEEQRYESFLGQKAT